MPPRPAAEMVHCRFCSSSDVNTIDSRPADRPAWRRRRKVCNTCHQRWSTIELPVEDIESILSITYKLDELSVFARGVHDTIEALKHVGDKAQAEVAGLVEVEPMTMRTQ